MTQPIPEGFRTLTPHITVKGAAKAIDFYVEAFGAKEMRRMEMGGTIVHAELRIGDSPIMLNDEFPEQGATAPPEGGCGVRLHLYVDDVDAWFERATKAGAHGIMPPDDMFWGDRYAIVADPFGHSWAIATQIEELTDEECMARAAQAMPPA